LLYIFVNLITKKGYRLVVSYAFLGTFFDLNKPVSLAKEETPRKEKHTKTNKRRLILCFLYPMLFKSKILTSKGYSIPCKRNAHTKEKITPRLILCAAKLRILLAEQIFDLKKEVCEGKDKGFA